MQHATWWKAVLVGIALTVGLPAVGATPARGADAPREVPEPLPVKERKDVRAVFDVSTDQRREGVGAGLFVAKQVIDAYVAMGVSTHDIHVSVVLHGAAGYWAVSEDAYSKARGKVVRTPSEKNPNKEIIRALVARGVSVEICANTMEKRGWKRTDLLPDVTVVSGAYPRIIDLQLRGYAYVRP